MHFQFEVGPPNSPGDSGSPPDDTSALLRQILDVQRQQLELLRLLVTMQDGGARWRAFVSRWEGEYPGAAAECKQTLASLERAYIQMIAELGERLRDGDDLDHEFTLNEFLDRYGIRLSQIGTLLNLIGSLADAAPTQE